MLFSLFSDPSTPALVSAIAAHLFGMNPNRLASFSFLAVFPALFLSLFRELSVKFLAFIYAYYYVLYDRPRRFDASAH